MVLPKNAVQFSSFFKYAFSLIATPKPHRLFRCPALQTSFSAKKVAKSPEFD